MIPTNNEHAALVQSIAPITVQVPKRVVPLEVRVTAPVSGNRLPILILSHGHGPSQHLSSHYGYGPLANRMAELGFCVLQPTHLDSMMLGLRDMPDPEAPLYWKSRAEDVSCILDHLPVIETAVPWLSSRLDVERVAVAGHSMGGHTACLLLGMQVTDPTTSTTLDLSDSRISAGIVLAGVGRGREALTEIAAQNYSGFGDPNFQTMTKPALIVCGDADLSEHLTVSGPSWHADPYHLAPAPKTLVTLYGAGHGLGGVSGYDAAETTDESPSRVEQVCRLSAAYLSTQLGIDSAEWGAARDAFNTLTTPVGRINE